MVIHIHEPGNKKITSHYTYNFKEINNNRIGIILLIIGLLLGFVGFLVFSFLHIRMVIANENVSSEMTLAFASAICNGLFFFSWVMILVSLFRFMKGSDAFDNYENSKIGLIIWLFFYPIIIFLGIISSLIEHYYFNDAGIVLLFLAFLIPIIFLNISVGLVQFKIGGKTIQKITIVFIIFCICISMFLLFLMIKRTQLLFLIPLEIGILGSIIFQGISSYFVLDFINKYIEEKKHSKVING